VINGDSKRRGIEAQIPVQPKVHLAMLLASYHAVFMIGVTDVCPERNQSLHLGVPSAKKKILTFVSQFDIFVVDYNPLYWISEQE
jgi:hypothetical protein